MVGTRRTWNLTVDRGSLSFIAPHGRFPARGLDPAVAAMVAMLPGGTEVQCECDGGVVDKLHVTRIAHILTDLTARVMELPDAVVTSDGRLVLARTKRRLDGGNTAAAAADLAIAMQANADLALTEYERLPADEQAKLLELLVAWQARRPASWRALRYFPIARWTVPHLTEALEAAFKSGGVFGSGPGVDGEALVDELARRGEDVAAAKKKLARLRKVRATEGDTFHRITPDLQDACVVGACREGVYIAGTVKVGQTAVVRGAYRAMVAENDRVLVLYALDGRELRRWLGTIANRVVDEVAVLVEAPRDLRGVPPRAVRLSDGKVLYEFPYAVERHDHELIWGVIDKSWSDHTMSSEVRRITGERVIALENVWVEDVWWDREHIYVRDETTTHVYDRGGKLVRAGAAPPPATVEIETADGRVTMDVKSAPWCFGYWTTVVGGGWQARVNGKKLLVAPTELGAAWVSLELAKAHAVQLAPPWIAFLRDGEPILLVALAEIMSASQIRVDGKWFAKRAAGDPRPRPPAAFVAWYDKLVAAGVTPQGEAAARDAHLLRVIENARTPTASSLARVLANHSPFCVEHDTHWFYPDDAFYTELTRALEDQGITVEEIARIDDAGEPVATIRVRRAERSLERQCEPMVYEVAHHVDDMLAELGSQRRLYALAQYQEDMFGYLVITREQRARLEATDVAGVQPGVASGY